MFSKGEKSFDMVSLLRLLGVHITGDVRLQKTPAREVSAEISIIERIICWGSKCPRDVNRGKRPGGGQIPSTHELTPDAPYY